MTKADFLDFALHSAKRAAQFIEPINKPDGKLGHLVCPKTPDKEEPTLREPEIRTAFVLEAEEKDYWYGIEWRTKELYQFKGETTHRRALTDFALLQKVAESFEPDVLVELKTGQPDTIEKDIIKHLAEKAGTGRCMFHVLHAARAGTLAAIEKKYNEAAIAAIAALADEQSGEPLISADANTKPWFVLLIMVLNHRGQKWDGPRCRLYGYSWNNTKNEWVRQSDEPIS